MAELLAGRTQAAAPDDQEVVTGPSATAVDGTDFAKLEAVRKRLLSVHPKDFEGLIAQLLVQSGFEDVQITRYSQDGGIDLSARPGRRCWPMRQAFLQVQAKRWIHTVGRKEVAELRGSLQPHANGCVVTTSHFSRAALNEAGEIGKLPIGLVDGYELAKIVKLHEAETISA